MKVAVIGCGVMGSVLARSFAVHHSVILCDKSQERSAMLAKELGAEVYARQTDAVSKAEVVVLAVKPKDLPTAAKAIGGALTEGKLLISILAGTSLETLKRYFPKTNIVRMMPNLGVTCRKGVSGLVDDPQLSEDWKKKAEGLLGDLGLLCWLPEDKVDALTALTSSGVAFVAVLIEAMVDSGILLGFTAHESQDFILKTLEGTVELLRATHLHPAELKWQVASPGGATIAGLKVLEEMGVRGALMEAYAAAFERGKEMHEETQSAF